MSPKPRPAHERFLNLAKMDARGCLMWQGHIGRNGYARHWADGKNWLAHRWSYEYHKGAIPDGLQIDHLCRNRACVNPDHLEAVTPAENMRRSTSAEAARERGRRTTHCKRGHEFTPGNTYYTGRGRGCRACKKLLAQRHYEANRSAYIEKAANWRRANPDRARELTREGQRRYREKTRTE